MPYTIAPAIPLTVSMGLHPTDPDALDLLEQAGQRRSITRRGRDVNSSVATDAVPAQHPHLPDVHAEAAEQGGDLTERAGAVGQFDDHVTQRHAASLTTQRFPPLRRHVAGLSAIVDYVKRNR